MKSEEYDYEAMVRQNETGWDWQVWRGIQKLDHGNAPTRQEAIAEARKCVADRRREDRPWERIDVTYGCTKDPCPWPHEEVRDGRG